jgi:hypothetical protein
MLWVLIIIDIISKLYSVLERVWSNYWKRKRESERGNGVGLNLMRETLAQDLIIAEPCGYLEKIHSWQKEQPVPRAYDRSMIVV